VNAGLDGFRYRTAGPVELHLGDARQVLAAMPDESVDRVTTSPPFWALIH
jgi:DNA modification methylase